MTFEMIERVALKVDLHSRRRARQLQSVGHVVHVSRRMKQAVVYVDRDQLEEAKEKLLSFDFVKDVSVSPMESIDFDFSDVLGPDDPSFIQQINGKQYDRSLDDIVSSLKQRGEEEESLKE